VPADRYSWAYKVARREFLARLRREGQFGLCFRCCGPVDLDLSGNCRDGPTVDHVSPLALGGDLLDNRGFELAHKRCNAAAGGRLSRALQTSRINGNGAVRPATAIATSTPLASPSRDHARTHQIIGGQCTALDGTACPTCPPPSRVW
jgi:hypothetical protein